MLLELLTAVVFTTSLRSLLQCSTNLTVKNALLMSSLKLTCMFCAVVLLLVIKEQSLLPLEESKQTETTQTCVLCLS